MYCHSCGREIAPDSRFCNRCGKPQPAADAGPAADRNPMADPQAPASEARVPDPRTTPETEIWRGGCSGGILAGAWLLWIVWTTFLATLWLFVLRAPQPWMNWAMLGASVLPAAWLLLKTFWLRLSIRYRLTTHRFFRERGVVARQIAEVELFRVDDVAVAQGILERILGVGTVTLVTSDANEPRLEIAGVADPVGVKEKIRAAVRATRAKAIHLESI